MTANPCKNLLCLALVSLLAACQIVLAEVQEPAGKKGDQDQTVRLRTELIELRAVVTDKSGKPIEDLKKEDFEVLENGVPQGVNFFSVERLQSPSKAGSPADKAPPRAGAAVPAGVAQAPARTVVLFVDTLHLSTFSFIRAKKQLKQFIDEQITDQDLVAVVTTSASLGALQQFTRDRRILKYAIDKITRPSKSDSLFTPYLAARVLSEDTQALGAASQIINAEEGAMPPAMVANVVRARAQAILGEEANFRKGTLLTLRAVCDRVAELPGQRMIAFVSDGFTMLDQGGGADNNDLVAATGRASRSGVVIYSFDAKGLTVPVEYQASAAISASALIGQDFSRFTSASNTDQQTVLRTLAYDTGGEAYLNRNDYNKSLQAMLDNNRIYYALAYYPGDNKDRKKFRNLTIRVKNHPDYVVRAQKGYFAAEENKTEVADTPRKKLFQAMLSPLPVTAIPVTSSADFVEREGDDTQVTLQVHLEGSTLQYKKQEESFVLNSEIVTTVFDQTGKLSDTIPQTVKAVLSAEQVERAKREGFRYSKRLSLKPGFYQLRVGVLDLDSELIGTSMSWVEVPNLRNGKLALSGLLLGKEAKKEEKAETAAAASKSVTRVSLIVGRASFKNGDIAVYRFVAYNAQAPDQADSGATTRVEILDGDAPVYQGDWQPLASRTVRKDAKGVEVGGRIELGLPPGIYSLRVTVKHPNSKNAVQRTADFEIDR